MGGSRYLSMNFTGQVCCEKSGSGRWMGKRCIWYELGHVEPRLQEVEGQTRRGGLKIHWQGSMDMGPGLSQPLKGSPTSPSGTERCFVLFR